MSNMEIKLDALMRLCMTDDPQEQASIREEIRLMAGSTDKTKEEYPEMDAEMEVRKVLLQLGTPDHLVGHPYVVQGILWSINDRKYLDNITYGLYPALAAAFDTTASRVERAIRHVIEATWSRGSTDALDRYFGNTVNPNKGKPTNGEFIARIASVVKMRLKYAVRNTKEEK